jgi:hypothetical protein
MMAKRLGHVAAEDRLRAVLQATTQQASRVSHDTCLTTHHASVMTHALQRITHQS